MKRFILVALALALGLGLATAQNITKSLQGSQDPRGPVGIDTSNSAYFPNHILGFGNTTAKPSFSGPPCSQSGTIVAGSTDVAGIATVTTSCTINFGSPFNATPACVVAPVTAPLSFSQAPAVSTTVTALALTGVVSGNQYSYICIGNQ